MIYKTSYKLMSIDLNNIKQGDFWLDVNKKTFCFNLDNQVETLVTESKLNQVLNNRNLFLIENLTIKGI